MNAARTRSGLTGCLIGAIVLVLVIAAVVFWIFNEAAAEQQRTMVEGMPQGWTILIGQRVTLPASVAALEPVRTDDGDGAPAVADTATGVWTIFRVDSAFDRLSSASPASEDSFTMSELLADTALDRWVRWAAKRRWRGLDRVLARSGADSTDLLLMRVPDYRIIRAATAALAMRGWVRAEHGDRLGADRDMRAAVGLGAMLVRHEPTISGFLAGRAAIHAGATGLQHLALLTRDAALADRAADAAAWSAPSTAADYDILAAAPDTALRLAGDDRIGLGWRAAALASAIKGPLGMPAARVFGLPRRITRTLDSLAARGGGDFGRLAAIAAATAHHVNRMGPRARMRRFGS